MKNNRRGDGYVMTCVFVLAIFMVASALMTVATSLSILRYTKENVTLTLDSYVMENTVAIFNDIKQGNNDLDVVDEAAYIQRLCQFSNLDQRGEFLYAYEEEGSVKYYLTVPEFRETDALQLEVRYIQHLPIRFFGEIVTYARVPVTVRSTLENKF